MLKGKIKDLLGTELPIIQAPMAGVQNSTLAIAVSEAGGLGSLPCGMLSIDALIAEIKLIKAATSKPYNLNFFCHHMPDYEQEKHDVWQNTLAKYFSELGIECKNSPNSATRMPFNHDIADAIEAFNPEFISFHFGLPDDELLARIKGWGTRIVSSATTVKEALWLEAKGVDGIIAQGVEAGGHRGMFLTQDISTQMGTFALLPQIVDQVSVPVIAAGGIVDAESVKASFLLGAGAAQIGTAYLLSDEATTSDLHRQALQSDAAMHTALTNVFSGRPARGIVNRVMADLSNMSDKAPDFPHAAIEITQLRSQAESQGDAGFSPLWCGQNTSGCLSASAKTITQELAGKV
ncbi:NAD(P)H-dependent flavin oxidoreductase [Marinomonas sp. PE14-40]|uniref:NAD(P)H-dependent flavin oxidoreductase n=1 Tax=Marinomonas sp. PE14-40 TaxID=3060621 RepID=UPI003F66E2F6